MKYRSVYRKYRQQKPKKQEVFYEEHRMELTHYETAERYPKDVMNSKTPLPTKAWEEERDRLNAERLKLSYQYSTLKDEMKEVEQIRKNIYRIMQEEKHGEQPTQQHGIEL